MECLIRFAQTLESFRKPEIEALATLARTNVEFLVYDDHTPFSIVKVPDEAAARAIIPRSILGRSIYEIWGQGQNYEELHSDVRRRTESRWPAYKTTSFRLSLEAYAGKRSSKEKTKIFESFAYLGFEGPIKMVDFDEEFSIIEEYSCEEVEAKSRDPSLPRPEPKRLYFTRWLANGSRDAVDKYDLKKRKYISTTSMDAELSLISANMALAAPGKIFYDPFVGTGSFCVAAAHFGAHALGSDIDGRSFKGRDFGNGQPIGLVTNLKQYHLEACFLDAFTSDLTNTPLRNSTLLDGIVCDPPYGVREGLKVLGTRDEKKKEVVFVDGLPTYSMEGYVPPKKQYSFEAMLDDILQFAANTLVYDGRLTMWMPTANDEYTELEIPSHPHLELVSVSVQPFNKWSRRLLTYRRLPEGVVSGSVSRRKKDGSNGVNADDLNSFRRKYFEKSKPSSSLNPPQPENTI